MIEEKGLIYTTPFKKQEQPKLCQDCQHYHKRASDDVCKQCLLSTSKAINWVKK